MISYQEEVLKKSFMVLVSPNCAFLFQQIANFTCHRLLSLNFMLIDHHKPGTSKNPNAFIWSERFKVAVGVAEALDYLHSDSQRVIHRDVKSSNVLLSDDFEPQVMHRDLSIF